MRKLIYIVVSLLLIAYLAHAEAPPVKNMLSVDKAKEAEICNAIQKTIKDGFKTKEVVKTGIQLGHRACLVIRCAIEGGGDLKEVVTGAIEAGATPAVVARCSVDAGADPKEVGGFIMLAGFPDVCYFEPQILGEEEMNAPPYGENTEGGFLSPSTP
jgi:hypothetical protein